MTLTRKRVAMHTAFWLVYFSITFFNELFLTSDFMMHSTLRGLLRTLWGEGNLLIIKMAIVYYVLYSFIPRWLEKKSRTAMAFEGAFMLLATVFIYRLVIRYVNWQFIYHDAPQDLSTESVIARYFYSLLDILQVVGITAAIRLSRMRIAAIQREKELEKDKLRSELLHLKAQVNPHFLFNMLNSVYALARTQSPQTPEVVSKLSDLLRYMLYQSEQELMPISEEVAIIQDYTALQQLRFGNRVQLTYEAQIIEPGTRIIPLLLFPLVENAYKHGVGTREAGSYVHISITQSGPVLHMDIKNAIVPENNKLEKQEGIGLANIRRRLDLLYRDHTLTINKDSGHFHVSLTINTESYVGIELFDSRR